MALRLACTRACHPARRSQGSDTDSQNGKGRLGDSSGIPLFFCLNRVRLQAHTRVLASSEVACTESTSPTPHENARADPPVPYE